MSENRGFFSALDADSDGEEGKYYVWQKKEIQDILEADSELFCSFYDVTESGNWKVKTYSDPRSAKAAFCRKRVRLEGETAGKTEPA